MDITKQSYESRESVETYRTQGLRSGEERVLEYFKSGKILDLGCGTGRTSIILQDRGLEVTAIDYSHALIEEARKLYPRIHFEVMDASRLEYGDQEFDYAFFSYNGLDYLYPETKRIQ